MPNATLRDTYGSDTWVAITASDSTTYVPSNPNGTTLLRPRALFIGVAGDVALADATGNVATFKNLAGGTYLPVQPSKVMSTNTTATNILGLY